MLKKFQTATFVSNKINVTGKNTAKIQGILTLHGVSKPVTLDVKLNKVGDSPITHKRTGGFTATANLKRSDFGITQYIPGLGDEVKLNIIEVEASKDMRQIKPMQLKNSAAHFGAMLPFYCIGSWRTLIIGLICLGLYMANLPISAQKLKLCSLA